MTCKECVHYEVCWDSVLRKFNRVFGEGISDKIKDQYAENNCKHFKPKSRFVELPCEVGQTVYELEPLLFSIWREEEEGESKCRTCDYFCEGGMGDPPCCSSRNPCYQIVEKTAKLRDLVNWVVPTMFTEIIPWGKTVFLSREEAEKALSERNLKK